MSQYLEPLLEQQLEFKIEKLIAQRMDLILSRIITIGKDFSIKTVREKSPFRNVLAVANESGSSIEIIKNYIRYQVGRRGGSTSKIWQQKNFKDQKMFAVVVVKQIDELSEDAEAIVKKIRQIQNKGDLHIYLEDSQNRDELTKNIHLKLSQLYLGYLAREHTALLGEE